MRIAESPAAVHANMRHGTVFSLTNTASGRLFGAYLDAAVVRGLLEDERRREKKPAPAPTPGTLPLGPLPSWKDFEAQLQEVRAPGISRSEGEIVPGVDAMSALAITAIGPAGIFGTAWNGEIAGGLKDCADAVSQRLGAARGR